MDLKVRQCINELDPPFIATDADGGMILLETVGDAARYISDRFRPETKSDAAWRKAHDNLVAAAQDPTMGARASRAVTLLLHRAEMLADSPRKTGPVPDLNWGSTPCPVLRRA